MGGSTALSVSSAIFLTIVVVQAQNSTASAANGTNVKVGWQDGPNQRGTFNIIWSCLSTVVACTWTILHLNVPCIHEESWIKTGRKAKWMLITIIFPEFVFSKAICELQMAVDDLHAMNEIRDQIPWKVHYGRGSQFLHKLFHCFSSTTHPVATGSKESSSEQTTTNPKESPIPAKIFTEPSTYSSDQITETRVWTLTHSYFANMGGLGRRHNKKYTPITAHALVHCCVGSPHDPLPSLVLEADDISDKNKADWLLKSIVVAQILWLLLSVIVRAAKKLPISQVEICTTAFAILAVATYFANWAKLKDVDRPVIFKMVDDTYECDAPSYEGSHSSLD
jgi:hypothetical protein